MSGTPRASASASAQCALATPTTGPTLRPSEGVPSASAASPSISEAKRRYCSYRQRWLQRATALSFGAEALEAHEHTAVDDADAAQITMDLHRAGRRALGVEDGDADTHRAALARVVRAACTLVPYCQAIAHVAAALLVLSSHCESEAFSVLALLLRTLPLDFFAATPPLRGCQIEVAALLRLADTREHSLLRGVHGAAVREALSIAANEWFLALWVGALPLDAVVEAWNLLLAEEAAAGEGVEAAGIGAENFRLASPPPSPAANLCVGLVILSRASASIAGVLAACAASGNEEGGEMYEVYAELKREVGAVAEGGPDAPDALREAATALPLTAEEVRVARRLARAELDGADRAKAQARARGSRAGRSASPLTAVVPVAAEETDAPDASHPRLSSGIGLWAAVLLAAGGREGLAAAAREALLSGLVLAAQGCCIRRAAWELSTMPLSAVACAAHTVCLLARAGWQQRSRGARRPSAARAPPWTPRDAASAALIGLLIAALAALITSTSVYALASLPLVNAAALLLTATAVEAWLETLIGCAADSGGPAMGGGACGIRRSSAALLCALALAGAGATIVGTTSDTQAHAECTRRDEGSAHLRESGCSTDIPSYMGGVASAAVAAFAAACARTLWLERARRMPEHMHVSAAISAAAGTLPLFLLSPIPRSPPNAVGILCAAAAGVLPTAGSLSADCTAQWLASSSSLRGRPHGDSFLPAAWLLGLVHLPLSSVMLLAAVALLLAAQPLLFDEALRWAGVGGSLLIIAAALPAEWHTIRLAQVAEELESEQPETATRGA